MSHSVPDPPVALASDDIGKTSLLETDADTSQPSSTPSAPQATTTTVWSVQAVIAPAVAMAVGASVSLSILMSAKLNARSSHPTHAIFISELTNMVFLVMLMAPFSFEHTPIVAPKREWTLLGGIVVVPSMATIAAAQVLGIQAPLLLMLLGHLVTAMLIDVFIQRSTEINSLMISSLTIVCTGVIINDADIFFSHGGTSAPPFSVRSAVYIFLCLLAGAGYAVSALCNHELARDVGSALRATFIAGHVNSLLTLPFWLWLFASDIYPTIRLDLDWHLWLLCALQAIAYFYAMAELPKYLSYTNLSLFSLIGRLAASAIIDVAGLGLVHLPFTWPRAVGLIAVTLGVALHLKAKPVT